MMRGGDRIVRDGPQRKEMQRSMWSNSADSRLCHAPQRTVITDTAWRSRASEGIPPAHRPRIRAPVNEASWLASLGQLEGRPCLVAATGLLCPRGGTKIMPQWARDGALLMSPRAGSLGPRPRVRTASGFTSRSWDMAGRVQFTGAGALWVGLPMTHASLHVGRRPALVYGAEGAEATVCFPGRQRHPEPDIHRRGKPNERNTRERLLVKYCTWSSRAGRDPDRRHACQCYQSSAHVRW